MGVRIVVVSGAQIAGNLDRVAAAARNVRPVWEGVTDRFTSDVARQFASSGSALGTPWKPLSPQYAAWKAAAGYPSDILVRTGAMVADATRPGVRNLTPATMEVGSDVDYIKYHHSKGPRRKIPYRPLYRLTPEARAHAVTLLAAHLRRAATG